MHSQSDWASATQKFQQSLTDSWGKAMQSFEQLGLPGNGNPALPALTFAPDKLQELQQAYLKEAAELWNHGLSPKPPADKRFSGDAWGANPVAAFSASTPSFNCHLINPCRWSKSS